jgi:hypothetical protein
MAHARKNLLVTMKTIVYQSYRTENVPPWIERCMTSVRNWAHGADFEYRFIDDRIFDCLPAWYRRAAPNVLVLTNLARLLVARDLLAAGYERTIWVDADILVFDPEGFRIDVTHEFAFVRETWVTLQWGTVIKQHNVNNSVSVFTRDNSFLEFGIWAHEQLVRDGTQVRQFGTTTRLLTALHQGAPLPLLRDVGILSPPLMRGLLTGNATLLDDYAIAHGEPIHATNLTASLAGEVFDDARVAPEDYAATVDLLEKTRGSAFHAAFGATKAAPREA